MKQTFALILIVILFASCSEERRRIKKLEKPNGWTIIQTPVKTSIRGISPLTDNILWASGSQGTWMRTLDGGSTWEHGVVAGMDSVDFRDIEAFDANTAVIMSSGQPAVVMKTSDGGKSWETVFEGEDQDFFDGMSFYKKKGFIIGDVIKGRWTLLQSKDEGSTWIRSENSPRGKEGSGSFAASGSGIIVDEGNIWFANGGDTSFVYQSTDGGIMWSEVSTPILSGSDSRGIFSLVKIDQDILVGVGGDYAQPDLNDKSAIYTKNGGKSWNLADGGMPGGYRSGVAYFPLHHWLVAVGTNGSDFSKDSGITWEKFSEEGFHAVRLDKSQSVLWSSGKDGKIGKLDFGERGEVKETK